MTLMTTSPDGSGWVPVRPSVSDDKPLEGTPEIQPSNLPGLSKEQDLPAEDQSSLLHNLWSKLQQAHRECSEAYTRLQVSSLRALIRIANAKCQRLQDRLTKAQGEAERLHHEAERLQHEVAGLRLELGQRMQYQEGLEMQLDAAVDIIQELEAKLRGDDPKSEEQQM